MVIKFKRRLGGRWTLPGDETSPVSRFGVFPNFCTRYAFPSVRKERDRCAGIRSLVSVLSGVAFSSARYFISREKFLC